MSRIIIIVFVAAWVACTLWATDAQMRESDQASLLAGAVELARGEANVVGNGSYNYDKQYLTYWLVAGVLKAAGGGDSEATIDGVVRVANYAATLLFSLGLMTLVLVQREWSGVKLAILGCVLLSPVVAFTGMTLSPNLVSGGFVLLLAAVLGRAERAASWSEPERARGASEVLRGPVGRGGPAPIGLAGAELVLVLLLSFAATAARQDAILVMPLLAILVVPFRSVGGVLKNSTLWSLVVGCLLAMITGRLIDPSPTSLPDPFFVLPTFVVFLAGGLGGALVLVVLFAGQMLWLRTRETLALGAAMLVPLVFYACLLYTPRHLFLAALALGVSVLLPRGGEIWSRIASARLGRVIVGFALALTLVPWLVGARMTGFTKGRLVGSEATHYPTADGFWPMGAYGDFYGRLAGADRVAVDHNQEVWAAWAGVDGADLPPGKGAIVSSGLASYGGFALTWHGRERIHDLEEADYVLLDDRTITKRQLSVDQTDHPGQNIANKLLSKGSIRVVGRAQGRSILLWTPEERREGLDDSVSLRIALSELAGGNDFRLARWRDAAWKQADWRGHKVVLASRSMKPFDVLAGGKSGHARVSQLQAGGDSRAWNVLELGGGELAQLLEGDSMEGMGVWIGCWLLPDFMDVKGYGK